jgi:hypothetical protein
MWTPAQPLADQAANPFALGEADSVQVLDSRIDVLRPPGFACDGFPIPAGQRGNRSGQRTSRVGLPDVEALAVHSLARAATRSPFAGSASRPKARFRARRHAASALRNSSPQARRRLVGTFEDMRAGLPHRTQFEQFGKREGGVDERQ